jgi:hypothetical protein
MHAEVWCIGSGLKCGAALLVCASSAGAQPFDPLESVGGVFKGLSVGPHAFRQLRLSVVQWNPSPHRERYRPRQINPGFLLV